MSFKDALLEDDVQDFLHLWQALCNHFDRIGHNNTYYTYDATALGLLERMDQIIEKYFNNTNLQRISPESH